jgi:hypothetical protein
MGEEYGGEGGREGGREGEEGTALSFGGRWPLGEVVLTVCT